MRSKVSVQQTNLTKHLPSATNQDSVPEIDRSPKLLALRLILILLIIVLLVEMLVSMRGLHQSEVDFIYDFEQTHQTALRLRQNFSSIQSATERYSSEDLDAFKEKLNDLYSQAIHTATSETFRDQPDKYKNMSQLEIKQHERKTMLDMIDSNLKEFVRSQRIELFERIGNTTQFKPNKIRGPWNLTRLNFQPPFMDTVQRKILRLWIQNETQRLQKDYEIHLVFTELPICVISVSKNNAKNYQYEYHLQSILNQNYSNYKTILIDQGSTDGTSELMKKYMRDHKKLPSDYTFIEGKQGQSRTQLIHFAIHKYCHPSDIAIVVDGNEQLLGTLVFKLLNTRYQKDKNLSLIYTNYFTGFPKKQQYHPKITKPYEYKTSSSSSTSYFRLQTKRFGKLVSFLAKNFLIIKQEDLKDVKGSWIDEDEFYVVPLLEMSCGNFQHLDEYLYLTEEQNEQEPDETEERNSHIKEYLKGLEPYKCLMDLTINKEQTK